MSNISTASTAVWSRSTDAAEQAECTSGNITKVDACADTQSSYNRTLHTTRAHSAVTFVRPYKAASSGNRYINQSSTRRQAWMPSNVL